MSEYSSQLRTQPNLSDPSVLFDDEGDTISAHGLSQAQRYVKNKPRFAEFSCSHTEVFRYAVLVTDAVIPRVLWGSDANYKRILSRT
ncbi:hypothetical protein OBBRIDRAFT_725657 [Obba rivulosa]|uniref:Uncharacterized protein n=1 Tax=Obba rivulosa TaxID=1052685 RepID=A0A8E2B2U8_9APHY|nr:hypothetical protein OBBRIDRAFT_725657 [Obba rivulosa]